MSSAELLIQAYVVPVERNPCLCHSWSSEEQFGCSQPLEGGVEMLCVCVWQLRQSSGYQARVGVQFPLPGAVAQRLLNAD